MRLSPSVTAAALCLFPSEAQRDVPSPGQPLTLRMTVTTPASQFDTSSEAQRRRGLKAHGTRNMLSVKYFRDAVEAWEEQGQQALNRMAFHDPSGFCNMIAKLMPQKIEHTTPTDGITDERLAQLLDIAEAALEKRQPLTLEASATRLPAYENADSHSTAEEGGGGPEHFGDAAGGGSTPTSRSDFSAEQPENPNKLKTGAEIAGEKSASVYDDRTPVTPYSSSHDIPHPVGRPFPKADHDVERSNKSALIEADEENSIDPASLF